MILDMSLQHSAPTRVGGDSGLTWSFMDSNDMPRAPPHSRGHIALSPKLCTDE